jgi:hypothetical protein
VRLRTSCGGRTAPLAGHLVAGLAFGSLLVGAVAASAAVPGRWHIPMPPGASWRTASLNCSSETNCVTGGPSFSVLRWDGSSWKRYAGVPKPEAISGYSVFSCPRATECFALGTKSLGAGTSQIIASLNGETWSPTPAPKPPARIAAIACPGESDCWAVGNSVLPGIGATGADFAEHWDGSTWRHVKTPNERERLIRGAGPGGHGVILTYSLESVSCGSVRSCVAVGRSEFSYEGQSLIRWDGSAWRNEAISIPKVAHGLEGIHAVSCASDTFCMAVGGNRFAIAYQWTGHGWKRLPIPRLYDPRKEWGSTLSQVACSSTTNCVAVGVRAFNGYHPPVLEEAWDGKRWSVVDPSGKPLTTTCDPSGVCVVAPN